MKTQKSLFVKMFVLFAVLGSAPSAFAGKDCIVEFEDECLSGESAQFSTTDLDNSFTRADYCDQKSMDDSFSCSIEECNERLRIIVSQDVKKCYGKIKKVK